MAHVDDHVLAFNDLHLALAASRSENPDDARACAARSTITSASGVGDNREVTVEVGRRLIDGALAFAEGDYAAAVEAILPVALSGDPHRRQPRPARHRQPDADRRGRAFGPVESGARAARRARRRPADRAHEAGLREGANSARALASGAPSPLRGRALAGRSPSSRNAASDNPSRRRIRSSASAPARSAD